MNGKMNINDKMEIWGKRLMIILMIGSVLVNIKSIFMDYDVDVEYAVTMAYRLANGGQMFTEMWEPHQTSAFLCALLIKPYQILFGTSGLLVYLNACSFIIYGAVVYFFYRTIREKVNELPGLLMTLFLFTVRVKDVQILEFANMQIMFSILLLTCLVKFYDNQRNKIWLVAGAIFLCAEVVSYPSCVIVYVAVVIIISFFSADKVKDAAIFTGTCFVLGLVYVGFFLHNIGLNELLDSLEHILISDNYHKKSIGYAELYFPHFKQSFIWMMKCFVVSAVISGCFMIFMKRQSVKNHRAHLKYKKRFVFMNIFAVVLAISNIYMVIVERERFAYVITYLLLIALGIVWGGYCSKTEKLIWVTGLLISLGSFLATMMLTDLDFLSVVRYLVVGVTVSLIPISKVLERQFSEHISVYVKYSLLILLLAVTVFQRGFMFKADSSSGYNLLDLCGIIKSGPEKGIVTEYFVAYNKNQSMADWSQYVKPGDRLLLVGSGIVDPINYLYEDVVISNPSSISTPTYTEEILEYWQAYPEKYPSVIAVSCWFGQMNMPEDAWIMRWIHENYQPCEVKDGMYWRFYRLTNS